MGKFKSHKVLDSIKLNQLTKRLTEIGWQHKLDLYINKITDFKKNNTTDTPAISVVIISNNFNESVEENINILKTYTKSKYELIFVNNGIDETEKIEKIKNQCDVYINLNINTGAYLARNIGAIFAEAEYIVFLEDDGIADANLIDSYIQIYKCYDVDFVRGVCIPKIDNELNYRQSHYYLGPNFCPSFVNLEGNCCIKSKLFYEVDGWDDNIFFGNGGPDLSLRILELTGDLTKQIYSPISIIKHDYARSIEHLENKLKKQIKSKERLLLKHKGYDAKLKNWCYLQGNQGAVPLNPNAEIEDLIELEKLVVGILEKYKKVMQKNYKYNLNSQTDLDLLKNLLLHTNKDIYIYGAGGFGKKAFQRFLLNKIEIDGFLDSNSRKFDTEFCKKKINDYNKISKEAIIIIASDWYYDIQKRLEFLEHKGDIYIVRSIS